MLFRFTFSSFVADFSTGAFECRDNFQQRKLLLQGWILAVTIVRGMSSLKEARCRSADTPYLAVTLPLDSNSLRTLWLFSQLSFCSRTIPFNAASPLYKLFSSDFGSNTDYETVFQMFVNRDKEVVLELIG